MQQDYLISIVIPTYNRPDALQRAIKTVFNQTYQNTEVLVVDDSDREQLQLNEQHIRLFNDIRIKHIICKDRKGPAFAINKGVKEAKGDFIAFLYDTDEWLIYKLEKQLKLLLENPNVGLVVCHSLDKRFKKETINKPKETITYNDLLRSFHLSCMSSYFVRRYAIDVIKGFDTKLHFEAEYDLAIRLSRYHKIKTIPEVLVIRHPFGKQTKEEWDNKIKGVLTTYKKHHKEYRVLGFVGMIFSHLKALGLMFTFFLAFIFHDRIYKLIIPIKERYEGG